jgi:Cupin domain
VAVSCGGRVGGAATGSRLRLFADAARAAARLLCQTARVAEASVRMSKNGLVTDGEGWFVVNARESRWRDEGPLGSYCTFEGKRAIPAFRDQYQRPRAGRDDGDVPPRDRQEAFLILAGECTLIVEGRGRQLVAWDFFYCPPGTGHSIVAAGRQAAVVLAVGARGRGVGGGVVYPVCKAAARYGASVARETTSSAAAYAKARARQPRSTWVKYRPGWLPGTR